MTKILDPAGLEEAVWDARCKALTEYFDYTLQRTGTAAQPLPSDAAVAAFKEYGILFRLYQESGRVKD